MARSRREWGWHQLDPRWAERIVADAGVDAGDLVIDVGAGLGALTGPLLASGARVIAVEAHPGRAARLRESFGPELVVVVADARDLRLPRRPFHVVANPAYGIGAALLRRLVHPGSRLVRAHVVLQQQVARRWAGPDAPGARRWQRCFAGELGRPVPRSAFQPAPAVNSRVLVLRRR
ncbi:MAG: rRNA adenine N(6)-methyltransferase family protein [Acidimicrobiales bacterium]